MGHTLPASEATELHFTTPQEGAAVIVVFTLPQFNLPGAQGSCNHSSGVLEGGAPAETEEWGFTH